MGDRDQEIVCRLDRALRDARYSALGMPSSVETVMAMLKKAGLTLALVETPERRKGN